MVPGCGRPRRVVAGPGGGWRPAVNGPGRLLRGLAGRMRSRCVPCTGACAPSPMPRLLRPVPAFPVFCCPRFPCSASCTPCPRARARVRVRVFRVLRPAPHARVFRVPHPRPAPRTRGPAPCACARARAPVSRAPHPCPWLRLLRPADGCPCSAPCLPPRTSGQVLPASASRRDEKKIGRFPTGTSRFCMHCSGARLTRACG